MSEGPHTHLVGDIEKLWREFGARFIDEGDGVLLLAVTWPDGQDLPCVEMQGVIDPKRVPQLLILLAAEIARQHGIQGGLAFEPLKGEGGVD